MPTYAAHNSDTLSTGLFDRPGTILAIDDDARFLTVLTHVLESHNHSVWQARTLSAGLEIARRELPDLILLDVDMPDGEGFDLCKRIKADSELQHIPVLIFTGMADHDAHVRALDSGANDFLAKPLHNDILLARVRMLLKYRFAVEALRKSYRRAYMRERSTSRELEITSTELQSTHNHLAQLMGALPCILIGLDTEWKVTHWNSHAAAAFGLSAQQTMDQPLLTLPIRWEDEAVAEALQQCRQRIQTIRTDNVAFVTPENARVLLGLTISPVKDHVGGFFGVLLFGMDITEKKRLEESFLHAQKMDALGRLAGGVAHDFNNLLTVMIGQTELLQRFMEGPERLRGSVEEVLKAGQRATNLTRQLLAFSRKQQCAPRLVNPSDVSSDLQKMLRRLVTERIELVFKPGSDGHRVMIDPGQLEQVIMNLVVNACDAMPEGGQIVLELSSADLTAQDLVEQGDVQPGRFVQLRVRDDGTGMDEGTVARIFEPFFTTKPEGKGTGLGLATVYGIIKQAGGFVEVESAPGEGTAFNVYLPRHDKGTEAAITPADAAPIAGGAETVLVVEDDKAVRQLVRTMLEELGYDLHMASSPEEAMQMMTTLGDRVRLLITDYGLPGQDGLEMYEHMLEQVPALKVLLISGHPFLDEDFAPESMVPKRFRALAPRFLPKPFDRAALARAIRATLDASGTRLPAQS